MIRGSGSFEQRLKSKVGVLLSFTQSCQSCVSSWKRASFDQEKDGKNKSWKEFRPEFLNCFFKSPVQLFHSCWINKIPWIRSKVKYVCYFFKYLLKLTKTNNVYKLMSTAYHLISVNYLSTYISWRKPYLIELTFGSLECSTLQLLSTG